MSFTYEEWEDMKVEMWDTKEEGGVPMTQLELQDFSSNELYEELARRTAEQAEAADAARAKTAAARAAARAERAAAQAKADHERMIAKWKAKDAEIEARAIADAREVRVEHHVEKRHQERALWNLPSFDDIACGDAEFDGRSRADDLDKLTAIEFSAVPYSQDSNDKLQAGRLVNESFMHGEIDDSGRWQPLFHIEARKDGSTYKRFVTEQPHHVSDLHQLDGGEACIVAVQVYDDLYHVMRCSKRWLDMRNVKQRNLWAKLHPNRNIPMRNPRQFVYEPEAYVSCFSADDAADLAWRWASEASIDSDSALEPMYL